MATVSKEMLQKHKQPMTHDELLAKIDYTVAIYEGLSVLDTRVLTAYLKALRAVVELLKDYDDGQTRVNEEFNQGVLALSNVIKEAIEKELG